MFFFSSFFCTSICGGYIYIHTANTLDGGVLFFFHFFLALKGILSLNLVSLPLYERVCYSNIEWNKINGVTKGYCVYFVCV